ncbi:hypothetical protein A0H81_11930 [Grifola frondosa]|uniref:Uncharacterized protein n=1 Tax=Grifola frondosa TaxID=5627 RepID=A0A1C7LU97_GRIFR|nr:hypothetical protein A0H81_11930 [Grifola frondosa]
MARGCPSWVQEQIIFDRWLLDDVGWDVVNLDILQLFALTARGLWPSQLVTVSRPYCCRCWTAYGSCSRIESRQCAGVCLNDVASGLATEERHVHSTGKQYPPFMQHCFLRWKNGPAEVVHFMQLLHYTLQKPFPTSDIGSLA